jgi:hypothetical protein
MKTVPKSVHWIVGAAVVVFAAMNIGTVLLFAAAAALCLLIWLMVQARLHGWNGLGAGPATPIRKTPEQLARERLEQAEEQIRRAREQVQRQIDDTPNA